MITVRYREGDPRAIALDSRLAPIHPLIGEPCPGCDNPFLPGDHMALVYVGPGGSPEARAASVGGNYHTGAAVALHAPCAGVS